MPPYRPTMPIYSAPPRPSTPRPKASPSAAGVLVALVVVLGMLAAVVVAVVSLTGGGDEAVSSSGADARSGPTTPPTTAVPRVQRQDMLDAYCDNPGAKWPEVPRYVPTEPSRTNVQFNGHGVEVNGQDRDPAAPQAADEPGGGSTVLSPQTDGRFSTDPTVLGRTRTVTCVDWVRNENVGKPCGYVSSQFDMPFQTDPQYIVQLARNIYTVTVYELHSGGILHKGEIWSKADACPERAYVSEGQQQVTFPITDAEVLSWLGSHFVDGTPR